MKDKNFKPSRGMLPAAATAPPPWMPGKGKAQSHESMMKELARSRAAKKGT